MLDAHGSGPARGRRLRLAPGLIGLVLLGLLLGAGLTPPLIGPACGEPATSPPTTAVTDPMAAAALRAFQTGQVELALGLVDSLLAVNPDHFTALVIRGHVTLASGDRDAARRAFEHAREIAPERPEGHHGLGLVEYDGVRKTQRAMLTIKKLFFRNPEKKAIQHFERTLELEPEFHDAALALAELHLSRGHADDCERVIELLRERLGAGYRLEDMLYHLARGLMGLELYSEAENVLAQLLTRQAEHNGGLLRLVELEMQTGRREQASVTYGRLADCLHDPVIVAELRLNLEPVLTTAELGAYSADPSTFLRRYWNRGDPTPTTPVNEYLIEHLDRLLHVRFQYAATTPRGYDDRGAIYLRFGPPDDSFVSAGGGATRSNESWAYNRISDRIITYDFVDHGGGVFELTTDLGDAVGTFGAEQSDQISALQEVFQERQFLSPAYARTANDLVMLKDGAAGSRRRESNEIQLAVTGYRQVSDERQGQAPLATYVEPPGLGDLDGSLALARFRGAGRRGRLEVYYGLPTPQLSFTRSADGTSRAVLEESFALYDLDFEQLACARRQRPLAVDDPDNRDQTYVGQLTIPPPGATLDAYLGPALYRLAFTLRDVSTNHRRVFWATFEIPDYAVDSLLVSDLQLARERQPDQPPPGLKPHPHYLFDREQPLLVHYQIYGLTPAADGLTDFQVAYELEKPGGGLQQLLGRLNPFADGGRRIEMDADRRGPDRDEIDLVELDLGELEAGDYRLTVRVKDRVSGSTATASARLKLLEQD